jgi:photosystem II stability/assembly factor-like uncharacterized protein
MTTARFRISCGTVGLALSCVAASLTAQTLDSKTFEALKWRELGPFRGGRSAAVTGVESQPDTYYFGAAGGGVWKSTDNGASWKNVSDGFFGGSIGAVAVSASDPNIVYVGGGEKTVRGNVSHGDGVWKSHDAGKSWARAGLEDSHHIPRIRVHPQDPDLVYAAVLGHLYEDHPSRGVYRSRDGGASWQKILFVNEAAGAVDLALDPNNPRILYAAFWRVRRTPWSLESGGEGSGLWKSTDGGDTWSELTSNEGLPAAPLGISGITVSPTDSENLYAIIEAEKGGVFRSRDGGKTWKRTSDQRELRQRAWYYTRIYADPQDEDGVYVVNVRFHRSKDGGKTFSKIATPHGDHHDLWISRQDPRRLIHGSDGGASVSLDGGRSWSRQDNQPTAQIYRLTTDDQFPYRIYGAQQDNTSLRLSHRTLDRGIGPRAWEPTAGGESGHIVPDPLDPDVVYGGSYGGYLTRQNHRTGQTREISVWPDNPMGWAAKDLRYRFQWNFPIFFSPHAKEVLYAAGNILFMSTDAGQSWKAISSDLTRNDPATQGSSGGPITQDNTSIEYYGTIFAALESPLEPGVFWTGSDDGLVQVSRDFGATWEVVTPKGLPKWALINSLEPHPSRPGGLYLAATAYKSGDFTPYLFKTLDFGRTWQQITTGIAAQHFTRVLRADPARAGLLYAGTERGVYVSFDDGGRWQPLQLNLPLVPITDLAVKDSDLVAATQGRGFWVLDDLALLRQLPAQIDAEPFTLFTPETVLRTRPVGDGEPAAGTAANPPDGAVLYYYLAEAGDKTAVRLEILAEDGSLIRAFTTEGEDKGDKAPAAPQESSATGETSAEPASLNKTAAEKAEDDKAGEDKAGEDKAGDEDGSDDDEKSPKATAKKGLNRFVWDLRYPAPTAVPGMIFWGGKPKGPRAVPANYLVRLAVDGDSKTAQFQVRADPRSSASQEALQAQFQFLTAAAATLDRTHRGILDIRRVRQQIDQLKERLAGVAGGDEVRTRAEALAKSLTEIEEALYQTRNQSPQDPLNFPIRLNNKLSAVAASVDGDLDRPTDQAEAVRRELTAAIDQQLEKLDRIWQTELPAFNELVRLKEVPALAPAAGRQEPALENDEDPPSTAAEGMSTP